MNGKKKSVYVMSHVMYEAFRTLKPDGVHRLAKPLSHADVVKAVNAEFGITVNDIIVR